MNALMHISLRPGLRRACEARIRGRHGAAAIWAVREVLRADLETRQRYRDEGAKIVSAEISVRYELVGSCENGCCAPFRSELLVHPISDVGFSLPIWEIGVLEHWHRYRYRDRGNA